MNLAREYMFDNDEELATLSSPITNAHILNIPTLIIQGNDDDIILYKDTKNFVNTVTRNDGPISFISMDHMGHSISTIEQHKVYTTSVTQFLRHHLDYPDGIGHEEHKKDMANFKNILLNGFANVEAGPEHLGL